MVENDFPSPSGTVSDDAERRFWTGSSVWAGSRYAYFRALGPSVVGRFGFFKNCIDLLRKRVVVRELLSGDLDLSNDVWVPAVTKGFSRGFEERRPRTVSTVDRAVVGVTLSCGADASLGCAHEERAVSSVSDEGVSRILEVRGPYFGSLDTLSVHLSPGFLAALRGQIRGSGEYMGNGDSVCFT